MARVDPHRHLERGQARMTRAVLLGLTALALAACDAGPPAPVETGTTLAGALLVLESDLRSVSALARVDKATLTETGGDPALGADAVLVDGGGQALVLNRDLGVILLVDRAAPHVSKRVGAQPAGDTPTNPQGAALAPNGDLWVARLDQPGVGVVGADGAWKGAVDLSAFDDDGDPDASAIRIEAGKAFVVLERLSPTFEATKNGAIAVVDLATKKPEMKAIELPGKNPYGQLRPFPDDATHTLVALCMAGNLAIGHEAIDPESGIDVVDLGARTAVQAISEKDLGGFCSDLVVASAHEAYAVVSDLDNDQNRPRVVAFDPTLRKVLGDALPRAGGYRSSYAGLAVLGGDLVVGDRKEGAAGLLVLDRATRTERARIPLEGLPPWALLPQ